jgi:DNA primase
MSLRNEDTLLVKSKVSMVDIAKHYGLKVNKRGFTICPFHNDKHASMKIFKGYTKKDGFYCHSCGASGDIFSYVSMIEGISFQDSVRFIASIFDVPISNGKLNKECWKTIEKSKIERILQELEEKIKQNDLNKTSEKIQLYENIAKNTEPFSDWWVTAKNDLLFLKYKWDMLFKEF